MRQSGRGRARAPAMSDSSACFAQFENQNDDLTRVDRWPERIESPALTVCHGRCADKITEVSWRLQKCLSGAYPFGRCVEAGWKLTARPRNRTGREDETAI